MEVNSSPDMTAAPRPFILEAQRLTKTYPGAGGPLTVVRDVSFSIAAGSTCAIVGPSGSGKTTLLGLCAGLEHPTSGRIRLDGIDLGALDEDGRARVRNEKMGFVFQSFQLIPTLTALENVMVPMELRGQKKAAERAGPLLDQVGLGARHSHYPLQLSGGEQQLVGLARAFSNRPKILFADEPTGNLDAETGALVIVTHDAEQAGRAQRIIRRKAGAIVEG